MSKRTLTATLLETSPRAPSWRAVFGGLTVPIRSRISKLARVPVTPATPLGVAEVLEVDVERLDSEQLTRASALLAVAFDIPADEVRAGLTTQGLPILAIDVALDFATSEARA